MTVVDPADLSPRDRYGLMINTVVPRPIAVVGTVSHSGQLNLAPFSCFNAVTSTPFTVMIGPAQRPDGTDKDTLANCPTLCCSASNRRKKVVVADSKWWKTASSMAP